MSAKTALPETLAAGLVFGKSPAGDKIAVRPPRTGQWFRVKHPLYGSRDVQASSIEKAVEAFVAVVDPSAARNKEQLKEFGDRCRIAELKPMKRVVS